MGGYNNWDPGPRKYKNGTVVVGLPPYKGRGPILNAGITNGKWMYEIESDGLRGSWFMYEHEIRRVKLSEYTKKCS